MYYLSMNVQRPYALIIHEQFGNYHIVCIIQNKLYFNIFLSHYFRVVLHMLKHELALCFVVIKRASKIQYLIT